MARDPRIVAHMSEAFENPPKRDAVLKVRVTTSSATLFAELCKARGVTSSTAMREALKDWTLKHCSTT